MIPFIPKELSGKMRFWDNDVFVREDVELTEEERKMFEAFRENLNKSNKDRFE